MPSRISSKCVFREFKSLCALVLLFPIVVSPALSEVNFMQGPPPVVAGDAPANVPPLATDLSPRFKRKDVRKALRIVADWQLDRARPNFSKDWTYAALYA